MNGNSFGTIFRITTWGESHGPALGVVIDGCPSGLVLREEDFSVDMARRQGGGAAHATPRKESDRVQIESGVFEGLTTGTPISLRIENSAQQSNDYEAFRHVPRPGHADLTTYLKHGHRDHRGGGRSSARETASRVAAGVVAKKILGTFGIELAAWLSAAGPHSPTEAELSGVAGLPLGQLVAKRDASAIGSPYSENWEAGIAKLREQKNSWGGSISCRIDNLPAGLGEPVFDKLNALLAHALMSLPAAVAFECGGGSRAARSLGSEIRDPIGLEKRPLGNRHGGLLGGITTGCPLFLMVSFHAPTSIPQEIGSVNLKTGQPETIKVEGRHDAFPLPRALPVVEAMVAITIADALLRARK